MIRKASRRAFSHGLLLLYIGVILFPLSWTLNSSFKSNKEIITAPWSFPHEISFSNYWNAWSGAHVGHYFMNSVINSTVSSSVSLLLGTATAYAVTRMAFPKISLVIRRILLLALLIPAASLLVPLYMLLRSLHLYNTSLALILPYVTLGIPWTVFMVSSFLTSIPNELEEAGIMDGLSIFGLLWRLIVPIVMPSSLCAAIMISVIPIVVMYLLLQKRIMVNIKA
ncbi:carbohydrate ABC transporter permease [Paenibacillus roseipurpureus]|uniref:Carbohydrate ABC transporter permease n=1 Tax=Paenibacillus roseopurpureus TaxID=2918901 RepID=A0AA96RNV1_9BACL|nr:carbohydrate ABC transporter permease [Paenibacillus sp. MBLB1832]WNR45922.1 carbohydrate ABC transporter permease [Paenibacillus sp. MBLB1832]